MMTTKQVVRLDTRVDDEAMRWASQFDRLSKSERAEFERWLAASELHKPRFENARREWEMLGVFTQLQDDPETLREVEDLVAPRRTTQRRRYSFVAAAAATVAAVAISIVWQMRFNHDATYATPIGQQLTVKLPDESTILLNTDTNVDVSYTKQGRVVRLLHGEAHFQVAHDPARPFIVTARNGLVRAVGTAFTVYVREQQVEVTVTEGQVEISQKPDVPDESVAIAGLLKNGDAPVNRLTEGHNATFSDTVEEVAVVDPTELARKLAWHSGWLEFDNRMLGEIVAELNRYTVDTIVIEDPALELHRVRLLRGKANDIDEILQVLDDNSDAIRVVDNANGRITIMGSLSQ